jgi:hypothetical protein
MKNRKESRVVLTDDQHDVLTAAAKRAGMPLATYLRYCAMQIAFQQRVTAEHTAKA